MLQYQLIVYFRYLSLKAVYPKQSTVRFGIQLGLHYLQKTQQFNVNLWMHVCVCQHCHYVEKVSLVVHSTSPLPLSAVLSIQSTLLPRSTDITELYICLDQPLTEITKMPIIDGYSIALPHVPTHAAVCMPCMVTM